MSNGIESRVYNHLLFEGDFAHSLIHSVMHVISCPVMSRHVILINSSCSFSSHATSFRIHWWHVIGLHGWSLVAEQKNSLSCQWRERSSLPTALQPPSSRTVDLWERRTPRRGWPQRILELWSFECLGGFFLIYSMKISKSLEKRWFSATFRVS